MEILNLGKRKSEAGKKGLRCRDVFTPSSFPTEQDVMELFLNCTKKPLKTGKINHSQLNHLVNSCPVLTFSISLMVAWGEKIEFNAASPTCGTCSWQTHCGPGCCLPLDWLDGPQEPVFQAVISVISLHMEWWISLNKTLLLRMM